MVVDEKIPRNKMVTQTNKLMSANDLISFLNSLTTSEMIELFPGRFHNLIDLDSKIETVMNRLSNDARLWKMMINSMQLQKSKLKIQQFISVDENGNLIKDGKNSELYFNGFTTEITANKIFFKILDDDQKYWITYLKDEGRFLHYTKIEDLVPLGIGITENYLKKLIR